MWRASSSTNMLRPSMASPGIFRTGGAAVFPEASAAAAATAAKANVPGGGGGAHHVVAALHNHRGYVADTVEIPQELAFVLEETAVEKIMTLDACHGQRVLILRPHGEGAFVQ